MASMSATIILKIMKLLADSIVTFGGVWKTSFESSYFHRPLNIKEQRMEMNNLDRIYPLSLPKNFLIRTSIGGR